MQTLLQKGNGILYIVLVSKSYDVEVSKLGNKLLSKCVFIFKLYCYCVTAQNIS